MLLRTALPCAGIPYIGLIKTHENIKHELNFHFEELGTIHPVGTEKHDMKIHLPK